MNIAPGTRLGPYEVVSKLGSGGMGEVWRAKDAHLGRDVALKVLPEAFTADHERSARFDREARLLASLNHPNIAQIYGVEVQGETRALVMELVDGPTLADRLVGGPLAADEALAIARQIAEALEEAHEKGIIHRDLKPQNIKLKGVWGSTPTRLSDGRLEQTLSAFDVAGCTVKVLDFGLAKAMSPGAEDPGLGSNGGPAPQVQANSPTMTLGATLQGMILGTAAYMSPEQAKGLVADRRADIWAFGVVLYEMLTGRPVFDAPTVPETLAQVLTRTPDLRDLPASTPAPIRLLLRRCLERSPKNRLHDIADARIVIDDVMAGRADEPAADRPAPAGPGPRRTWIWPVVAAAALALGLVAGRWSRPAVAGSGQPAARLALALPDGYTISTADVPQIAISRDGAVQAVVAVDQNGTSQILLRRSDEFEPAVLAGTEGALSPFFSPTGDWVGFLRDDALMKIPVGGGPAIRLATIAPGARGAAWGDDGYIYFAPDFQVGLSRVPETGGTAQAVTQLDTGRSERTHRWPDALPEGDAVLYTSDTQGSTEYYDDARIEVVRPSSGEHKVLVEGASMARFAPGGFVVFARAGSLYAIAFDAQALTTRGTPIEVVKGVSTNVGSGAVQFAMAWNGSAVWAPGGLAAAYRIVWVDRDGRETPVPLPPVPYQELALSPDGRRLALVGGQGGVSDLWVADLERGGVTRLTTGMFVRTPVWSPDGTRLVFSTFAEGEAGAQAHLEWQPSDGRRPPEVLLAEKGGNYASAFSPDGASVLFFKAHAPSPSMRLGLLPLAGDRRPADLPATGPAESFGSPSPDGRWLAYVSHASGQDAVFVRPYAGSGGRWQVSLPSGDEPRWSADGRSLYYRADSVLYRAAIDTSHGFSAGRPVAILDRVASGQDITSYAFSPDGSRIVTFRAPPGSGAQRTVDLDLGFADRLAAAK